MPTIGAPPKVAPGLPKALLPVVPVPVPLVPPGDVAPALVLLPELLLFGEEPKAEDPDDP
jgi:hypothetical protein